MAKADSDNGQNAQTGHIPGDSHTVHKDLTELPNDVFLMIVSYLAAEDSIVCRRVSCRWFAIFTADEFSLTLTKWHFPKCRELRMLNTAAAIQGWTGTFTTVARRYHYLRAAKPRLVEKISAIQEEQQNEMYWGIAPWSRRLRWNENTAIFQHSDPPWTLEDGLLIYLGPDGRCIAYNLETQQRRIVPFDISEKTIRRLRLADDVLVIEWCEREPYHQLNDRETVHRHFATAYDVQRRPATTSGSSDTCPALSSSDLSTWTITFRCEWKIHFLGLPPNHHDRFFSTHNRTHYALYIWQPNRSPWGEEDPLEQLVVWDISSSSTYRPSSDPTGKSKPAVDKGAFVILRLSWRELDFLGLRQRHTPSLRQLLLDEGNVYIHEEDHRWLSGEQSTLSPPRHHRVRCTGIPLAGAGPRWFDECCADGDVNMSFCPRFGSTARAGPGIPVTSSSTWPGFAPCWRHEEFPYLTVTDMVDVAAGVRIVARQCFMVEALSVLVAPKFSIEAGDSEEIRFPDDMWQQMLGKGCIRGDERWVVGQDLEGNVTILRF